MRRRRLAVLAVLLGAALVLPLANPSGGYREYGVDAVNVDSGQVSRYWLAPDQGMVMAASATSSPATACSATSPRERSSGPSGPCWPWRSSPPAAEG